MIQISGDVVLLASESGDYDLVSAGIARDEAQALANEDHVTVYRGQSVGRHVGNVKGEGQNLLVRIRGVGKPLAQGFRMLTQSDNVSGYGLPGFSGSIRARSRVCGKKMFSVIQLRINPCKQYTKS